MDKKLLPIFLIIVSLLYIFSYGAIQQQIEFESWMKENGKEYDGSEKFYRFSVYLKTVEEVKIHNLRYKSGEESYYTAVNLFADLTDEEFMATYLSPDMPTYDGSFSCSGAQPPSKDIPTEFDWTSKSAVSPVKAQLGTCTSGYAIATVDAIESGRFITTSQLRSLSAQQILDCSQDQGNSGCKGGNIVNSFEYIKKGGIALENTYPYRGNDGKCTYNIGQKDWEILGCVTVTPKVEQAIKAAIYHQPIITSINSSKLKTYSGGIYESGTFSSCKTAPDTWMVMVGYGKDGNKNFWKLKNSWGSKWGDKGYLKIIRKGDGEGECGVQNELYFPID